jgi:hypothetical protein
VCSVADVEEVQLEKRCWWPGDERHEGRELRSGVEREPTPDGRTERRDGDLALDLGSSTRGKLALPRGDASMVGASWLPLEGRDVPHPVVALRRHREPVSVQRARDDLLVVDEGPERIAT